MQRRPDARTEEAEGAEGAPMRLVTSALLVVTSALLLGTNSY